MWVILNETTQVCSSADKICQDIKSRVGLIYRQFFSNDRLSVTRASLIVTTDILRHRKYPSTFITLHSCSSERACKVRAAVVLSRVTLHDELNSLQSYNTYLLHYTVSFIKYIAYNY